jgi:uncharacterized membrane protein
MNGYFWNGMHGGYGGMGHGMLFFALTLIILALLFAVLVNNKKKKSLPLSEAEEILRTRFVNGEITKEEYQKMKKVIR